MLHPEHSGRKSVLLLASCGTNPTRVDSDVDAVKIDIGPLQLVHRPGATERVIREMLVDDNCVISI
ncbi:hypothetical protein PG999_012124 [Apiospora kogelbergensis]|uniref:Uncharacterized protein n=1 Tax=Apiospora kogelbergensis TaxID=1337665 RepID=A0AAW0QGH8_9PEZI